VDNVDKTVYNFLLSKNKASSLWITFLLFGKSNKEFYIFCMLHVTVCANCTYVTLSIGISDIFSARTGTGIVNQIKSI